MSRSLAELRYELKIDGKVHIPQVTVREIVSQVLLILTLALAGIAFLIFYPWHMGRWALAISLIGSAAFILVWNIRDWRRQLVVTSDTISNHGDSPILWADVEKIGVPAARSLLSIQLTSAGLRRHYGEPESVEHISNDMRTIVWNLPTELSDSELRFLRELVNGNLR